MMASSRLAAGMSLFAHPRRTSRIVCSSRSAHPHLLRVLSSKRRSLINSEWPAAAALQVCSKKSLVLHILAPPGRDEVRTGATLDLQGYAAHIYGVRSMHARPDKIEEDGGARMTREQDSHSSYPVGKAMKAGLAVSESETKRCSHFLHHSRVI